MSHRCIFRNSNTVCFEIDNELWVKEYVDNVNGIQKEGRTYEVNFCPECGFQIPKTSFFRRFPVNMPDVSPDENITHFNQSLSTAIAQMNHNVEIIKAFMRSQNIQNECFLERELRHSQEICRLERQILNLEKTILERGNP